MSFRRRLKSKRPPKGWELIEDVIEDFEQQLKEAVNEDHNGKRKNEGNWKIHRLHWEKNRFIYDLMYVKKVMNKELYDWLVREKIADGALIAKWRKPGYEILCSMLAIQRSNHNFGTTSHCRVPLRQRAPAQRVTPDVQTGCICCASGDGKFGGPVWWNTPLDDDANDKEGAQGNRAVWAQATDEAQQEEEQGNNDDEEGGQPGPSSQGGGGTKKRPVKEVYSDEDELEEDVKKRLEAMRRVG